MRPVKISRGNKMSCHRGNRFAGVMILTFAFLLGCLGSGFSQTADQFVELGKADLANGDLSAANTKFQSALSVNANHEGANFFYAMTSIMMVSNSSAFNTLLDRAGVSAAGRDIFQWEADFERDAYGNILLPADAPTGAELQSFARNDVLPVISGAINNLGKVGSTFQTNYDWAFEMGQGESSGLNTFTSYNGWWNINEWVGYKLVVNGSVYEIIANTEYELTVSTKLNISAGTSYNYKIVAPVEIDYGDALVIRGSLNLAKAAILIFSSYNFNVDIDAVVSLMNAAGINIQAQLIQTYPQLLNLLPAHQMSEAKASVRESITQLTAAVNFILNETDSQANDLMTLSADEGAKFSATLAQWNNALDGPALIGDLNTQVDLTQFFDYPKNLRNYLPKFKGYLIKKGTVPDPTCGAIFPAMTATELYRLLAAERLLAPMDATDFDGDGKSDLAVWRSSSRIWYVLSSGSPGSYTSTQWGIPGDKVVSGDYDGDGKADIAMWRPSTGIWYIRPSGTGGTYTANAWGISSDIPVSEDYDGDGKADLAVWRPSNGTWYVRPSRSPGSYTSTQWGLSTDIPVPGDYDGDGNADVAVWRPSTGIWYLRMSSYSDWLMSVQWGMATDIPVPGDYYDWHGYTDIPVWRPSSGVWYVRPIYDEYYDDYRATQWGTTGDTPVSGDYDGDGKADIAVWRPSTGIWYVRLSGTQGSYTAQQWGMSGDMPISAVTGILNSIP